MASLIFQCIFSTILYSPGNQVQDSPKPLTFSNPFLLWLCLIHLEFSGSYLSLLDTFCVSLGTRPYRSGRFVPVPTAGPINVIGILWVLLPWRWPVSLLASIAITYIWSGPQTSFAFRCPFLFRLCSESLLDIMHL